MAVMRAAPELLLMRPPGLVVRPAVRRIIRPAQVGVRVGSMQSL